ncbi:hypothetical protein RUND412_006664 [Rhizina undulata]
MGSVVLPHLKTGWHVDQAIMSEDDRLVVIRFGRDWDPDCMRQDEILYRIADKVKNFAVIYLCDIDEVPDFNKMYELYDAVTIMFFFRNKHMMCDFGTGNNNKMNWVLEDKQELIDIIETIYKGARKGRGLVVSPKDYTKLLSYENKKKEKGGGRMDFLERPKFRAPLLRSYSSQSARVGVSKAVAAVSSGNNGTVKSLGAGGGGWKRPSLLHQKSFPLGFGRYKEKDKDYGKRYGGEGRGGGGGNGEGDVSAHAMVVPRDLKVQVLHLRLEETTDTIERAAENGNGAPSSREGVNRWSVASPGADERENDMRDRALREELERTIRQLQTLSDSHRRRFESTRDAILSKLAELQSVRSRLGDLNQTARELLQAFESADARCKAEFTTQISALEKFRDELGNIEGLRERMHNERQKVLGYRERLGKAQEKIERQKARDEVGRRRASNWMRFSWVVFVIVVIVWLLLTGSGERAAPQAGTINGLGARVVPSTSIWTATPFPLFPREDL